MSHALLHVFGFVLLSGSTLAQFDLVSSPVDGDRFGAAVVGAGDVDGDGVPDVLVGAWRSGDLAGRVDLLSGSTGARLRSWSGDEAGDRLGTSLALVGDLDGDGFTDAACGAPSAGTCGRVRCISLVSGAVLLDVAGEVVGEGFGRTLAAPGDLDGDGVADLVIGAPLSSWSGSGAGRVALHSGRDGARLWQVGGAPGDQLGAALAAAGDQDGDGWNDVLVGVPFADGPAFNAGRAEVLAGVDGRRLWSTDGQAVGDLCGHFVAGGGDLDGDGWLDLAVSHPHADTGAIDSGRVDVHGVGGVLLGSVAGRHAGERLGVPAFVGDLDGDGRDELAVGAPGVGGAPWAAGQAEGGRVTIHGGAGLDRRMTVWGRPSEAWFGFAVTGGGDLDGDGWAEVLVGAPGHDDVLDVAGRVERISLSTGPSGAAGIRGGHPAGPPLRRTSPTAGNRPGG